MTLKQFLESEGVKINKHHITRLSQRLIEKSVKEGVALGRAEEVVIVRDYPEEFLPKMKKVLKEYQFLMKVNAKKHAENNERGIQRIETHLKNQGKKLKNEK